MLPTNETDAERVRVWLGKELLIGADVGKSAQGLAVFCGVTPQAVHGWKRTGRISKSHLQRAAEYFGNALIFGASATAIELHEPASSTWPFRTISLSEIAQLTPQQLERLEASIRLRLDEWDEDKTLPRKQSNGR
jgi:hypothetical protein